MFILLFLVFSVKSINSFVYIYVMYRKIILRFIYLYQYIVINTIKINYVNSKLVKHIFPVQPIKNDVYYNFNI